MPAIFIFKKEPQKKYNFSIFLQGRYFIMVGSIDINVDEFLETSVGFLKSVVSQLFPKYSQKYDKIQLPLKLGTLF